jgi:gluconolactonase
MKSFLPILFLFFLISCGSDGEDQDTEQTSYQTTGSIEQMDEELAEVLDVEALPEILGGGYEWTEGPVWVEEHDFLLFSDIPPNKIYQWKEGEGVSLYLDPAGYTGDEERGGEKGSNGLMIGQQGDLLLCQHGDRRIARMDAPLTEPAPEFETLIGSYEGKKLNSPNDLVQHSNGDIYFTDPPYGLEGNVNDPAKELDFQGVYRLTPSGELTLLTDELSRPNGIALSPDEKTLYVANSDPDNPVWMAYDVQEDGSIDNGRVFGDASESVGEEEGLPDGMKVDEDGYLYATGPGGVWIFAPDGRILGKIKTGRATSNCAIGNGGMLYMTADDQLMRIPLR